MFDRSFLFRNARGLILLVTGLFLLLSVAGYDPSDHPTQHVWPANTDDQLQNPCGPVGARIATLGHTLFGTAVWFLLLGWFVLTLRVLLQKGVRDPWIRLGGGILLLVTVASVVQVLKPDFGVPPLVGSGGYLGAGVTAILQLHLGLIGMSLVLGSTGIVGLVLCSDLILPSISLRRYREGSLQSPMITVDRAESPTLPAIPRSHALPSSAESPVPGSTEPTRRPAPAIAGPDDEPSPQNLSPKTNETAPRAPHAPPAPSMDYEPPPIELLEPPSATPVHEHQASIQNRAMMLEKTLLEHGCQVRVVQIDTGPVITQFEIELEAGLRVSKIVGLANDLAIALAVPSVRIVAPIPGKTTVGIEVPNELRSMVRLREIIEGVNEAEGLKRAHIPLFLGKDVKGNPLAFDLAAMPHLLIAGRTGTGKSVCLNAMIGSILMTRRPDECKLILVDPKMVELSQYKQVPHLMHPVVTDMKKAEALLAWACEKMDERYTYLARAGVRSLHSYNALGAEEIFSRLQPEDEEEQKRIPTFMPHIVIVVDEMSDMMMTAAKEVESHIVRLAQKARAVGMHLIVATQKPTVDVITGLIKGNLPARIAFQVSSRGDSRVVLDEMGADKLLGNGDMLFLIPGTSHLVRAQGTYVSDTELERLCNYLAQYPVEFSKELMQLRVGGKLDGKDRAQALKERDELYESAIEVIIREQRGSCSLLQRALGIGYGRAARLIDFMAEDGIVGEYKSGAAREVLYSLEEWELLKEDEELEGGEPSEEAA